MIKEKMPLHECLSIRSGLYVIDIHADSWSWNKQYCARYPGLGPMALAERTPIGGIDRVRRGEINGSVSVSAYSKF